MIDLINLLNGVFMFKFGGKFFLWKISLCDKNYDLFFGSFIDFYWVIFIYNWILRKLVLFIIYFECIGISWIKNFYGWVE